MRIHSYRLCIVCAVATALIAIIIALAGAPEARADSPAGFLSDVAPVLRDNCFSCHNTKRKSGKLDLTSFAGLMTGGVHESTVVPGRPAESELVTLLTDAGPRAMPPRDKCTPLPASQIETIRKWVEAGAKPDAGLDPRADIARELRKRSTPPSPPGRYARPVPVTALAFSPDGRRVVTGGQYELCEWEASTGRLTARIRTGIERTTALLFHPDGTLIVAGGQPGLSGTLAVYSMATPGEMRNDVRFLEGSNDRKVLLRQLHDADDCLLAVALSADGKRLAAAGADRAVRIWDTSAGPAVAKSLATYESHADWVTACAFSPSGRYLLTAGRDKTVKCFDIEKNEPLASFPEHQAAVQAVGVFRAGDRGVSAGADNRLRFWTFGSEMKQVNQSPQQRGEVLRLVVDPESGRCVSGSADQTIRVWKGDGGTGRVINDFGDVPTSLALTGDGARLTVGGLQGTVAVYDMNDEGKRIRWVAAPGLEAGAK
ncbi:MAG: hypothetical protein K1X57_08185 [Gemmataceae bacterium]|nr:hypothetical protein [Gemmataceae bacterium]